jgi:hypothetical protein
MGRTNVQAAEPCDVWFGTTRNARKPAPDGTGGLGLEFLSWVSRHSFVGWEWGKQAVEAFIGRGP